MRGITGTPTQPVPVTSGAVKARQRQIGIAKKRAAKNKVKRATTLAWETANYQKRLTEPWTIVRKT
jgi:hypothetical protein